MSVASLIDTNILVYRYDPRFPEKQQAATALLRRGIEEDSVRLPHQAIIEFIAAVTRPLPSKSTLLSMEEACREAEELLSQFTVLYPNEAILRLAHDICGPDSGRPRGGARCSPGGREGLHIPRLSRRVNRSHGSLHHPDRWDRGSE